MLLHVLLPDNQLKNLYESPSEIDCSGAVEEMMKLNPMMWPILGAVAVVAVTNLLSYHKTHADQGIISTFYEFNLCATVQMNEEKRFDVYN